MGMDMYIDKVKRNPNNKQEVIERAELCYWRKFWGLHCELGLYSEDDYGIDVPMTKSDIEKAIEFACHNEDYFCGFSTVPSLCELLRDYDEYKENGWDIVYNANW